VAQFVASFAGGDCVAVKEMERDDEIGRRRATDHLTMEHVPIF
jgi:hypothetical protein